MGPFWAPDEEDTMPKLIKIEPDVSEVLSRCETREETLAYIAAKGLTIDMVLTVCSECNRACCWHGEFMCEDAYECAVTTDRTIAELVELREQSENHEHPDYWVKAAKEAGLIDGPDDEDGDWDTPEQELDALRDELQEVRAHRQAAEDENVVLNRRVLELEAANEVLAEENSHLTALVADSPESGVRVRGGLVLEVDPETNSLSHADHLPTNAELTAFVQDLLREGDLDFRDLCAVEQVTARWVAVSGEVAK